MSLSICLGSACLAVVSGCAEKLPAPPIDVGAAIAPAAAYQIGPLDQLQVFVWRAQDLSVNVPVRPDGRVSLPLVGDLDAAGKTVTELSTEITKSLREFMQNPVVTVTVTSFGSASGQTVQVVGEAGTPTSIPYRTGLTILDVMVAVGGLTEFAAGNDARLIRKDGENEKVYGLRLESLLSDGDLSQNFGVLPGDTILIPKSFF